MDAREKWNRRFAKATEPNAPAKVLSENLHLLPKAGLALDLASGLGGNALLLAQRGLVVDAVDTSNVALEKLAAFAAASRVQVNTLCRDLEAVALPDKRYDVIVCSHYLHRPLCSKITMQLRPGGLLFYQTFTVNTAPGEGPRTPAYLLETNELLALFRPLQLVYYREEGSLGQQPEARNTARLVARQPEN